MNSSVFVGSFSRYIHFHAGPCGRPQLDHFNKLLHYVVWLRRSNVVVQYFRRNPILAASKTFLSSSDRARQALVKK